ncbi:interleukin-1 receptor-associated kinase 1-binding protein 1 homolog [Syngnathoides biaculeatus]|uniref:interleukin-1 receptor-associated kinase 1-binding protein 1 homolog n=1 Tax=Syngnathoides biaculeatus TaxID=300417 RepID=UPI002ADE5B20|nr:interleukin-1 receptor-associated kinase 1-binding protein 1 homolog [Syngnathoides biaculeatus]
MDNRLRIFPGVAQPVSSVSPFAVNEAEQGVVETQAGSRHGPAGSQARELHVTGTAEVSQPADRASVRLSVGNSKATVNEVTSSVSRRLEYILQAIRQHGVKEEVTVRKFLHRDEEMYHMNVEVTVTFSDFEKMEQACSVLLEKLDRSVSVGQPRFFHSAECLNNVRQSACVLAVENAQQKASRVSQLLGQNLGAPTLVREEETREWRSHEEDEDDEGGGGRRGQEATSAQAAPLPRIPSVTASSRVSVYFRMRDGNRKKY